MTIGADGTLIGIKLIKSSGNSFVDDACVNAAQPTAQGAAPAARTVVVVLAVAVREVNAAHPWYRAVACDRDAAELVGLLVALAIVISPRARRARRRPRDEDLPPIRSRAPASRC